MLKKIIAVILACISVACLFGSAFSVAAKGESHHIPRVVSVVYDNTLSMYYDKGKSQTRWAYTSYAMQAFCAMMTDEDILYVTYLNGAGGKTGVTEKLDLSNGKKQRNIEKIKNTPYGGDTYYVVDKAAAKLREEYAGRGNKASYFLIVLTDGILDDESQGTLKERYNRECAKVEKDLAGADFTPEYFDMTDKTGSDVTNSLKDIGNMVMGRQEIKDFSLNGNTLKTDLPYPAFSVVVFAQSSGNKKMGVSAVKTSNGKALKDINTFSVACPTKADNSLAESRYKDLKAGVPEDPPSGMVSLIKNGSGIISKGNFEATLSSSKLNKSDITVLVEPAVKVDCKFYLNGGDEITFEEASKQMRIGDSLKIKCCLREITEDGKLGNEVDPKTLNRDYALKIDGKEISGSGDTFEFDLKQDYSEKEMDIEATISGFAPFAEKKKLGKLKMRAEFDKKGESQTITVTKPVFLKMQSGEEKLTFPFSKFDKSLLGDYSVDTDWEKLPEGKCSELSAVSLSGNSLEYNLAIDKSVDFDSFPDKVTVSLKERATKEVLYKYELVKQDAGYVFETVNPFEKEPLTLSALGENSKKIVFSLKADYDGDGKYEEVEEDAEISLDAGDLPGKTEEDKNSVSFTPVCEDVSALPAMGGKTYSVAAKAVVGGKEITSDPVTIAFADIGYRLEVQNDITAPLTPGDLQQNDKKILFTLTADYDGDGNYEPLADWDLTRYEELDIESGGLSGDIDIEKDENGVPTGKSFTPKYSESLVKSIIGGSEIVKQFTVSGELGEEKAETSVSISAVLSVQVFKDGITVRDTSLIKNEESVLFIITTEGGYKLNAKELELLNLTAENVTYSKKSSWVSAEVEIRNVDGEACIACTPVYSGPTFISPAFWNCFSVFFVPHGQQEMTLKTGGDSEANGIVTFTMNTIVFAVLLIIFAAILIILYIIFCLSTRLQFVKGVFHVCVISKWDDEYRIVSDNRTKSRPIIKPNHFFHCFSPTVIDFEFAPGKEKVVLKVKTADRLGLKIKSLTPVVQKFKEENPLVKVAHFGGRQNFAKVVNHERSFQLGGDFYDFNRNVYLNDNQNPNMIIMKSSAAENSYMGLYFLSNKQKNYFNKLRRNQANNQRQQNK